MIVQSLSIVVPNKACINNCEFCVSKMHVEDYKNQLDYNLPFYDLYIKDYIKRMEYARDNGCNTVMLTGNSEPQQNRQFLMMFGLVNMALEKPFRNIEMQTTGTRLDDGYLRFLRNHVGVNTISLSLSSFDNDNNAKTIHMVQPVDIAWLCKEIKKYDFTLRLSINLVDGFAGLTPKAFFAKANELGADQIIFRVMYTDGGQSKQSQWLAEHALPKSIATELHNYVAEHGVFLDKLEYGYRRMTVDGLSCVIDDDCMAVGYKDEIKYLILREDCKLYTKWNEKSSLVF